MNKTPYDDWVVNILLLIDKIIKQFMQVTSKKLSKKEIQIIKDTTASHISNIRIADNQRRSRGCNYTYVKLEFLSEDSAKLLELCLKNVETTKDLTNLDFKDNYAYIRGLKYAGALFQLGDSRATRKFIKETDGIIDNKFKLSIVEDKDEYRKAPREVKIIF